MRFHELLSESELELGSKAYFYNQASEKGLDLSKEARINRAKEQGFTIFGFHGSPNKFLHFRSDIPIFLAKSESEAKRYGSIVYQLLMKDPEVETSSIYATHNPNNVRDIEAVFDPDNLNSSWLFG